MQTDTKAIPPIPLNRVGATQCLWKVEYHHRCSPSNPTPKKAKTPADLSAQWPTGAEGQTARHT
jgi:hypothetical protein